MQRRIDLYVQPAYNYKTNEIEYAEILIRGYRGIQSVRNILTFIEKSGIEDIFDMEVFEETLKTMRRHKKLKYPIGVNLCPSTIAKQDIYNRIMDIMNKYKFYPDDIIIEVNERTDFMNKDVKKNIKKLRQEGFKIALDDFGVESSNLYTLLSGNVDILKIDKAFIDSKNIEYEESQCKILKRLLQICNDFNLKHIVEGIETNKQLKNIEKLGYNLVQGFLYEKPLPFEEFLTRNDKETV